MIALPLPAGGLRVLCLGAHPDDIEIGCGGALLALTGSARASVRSVVLTGSPERRREAEAACRAFTGTGNVVVHGLPDGRLPSVWGDVKDLLEREASASPAPDLIFAPRTDDAHQDHRVLGELVTTCWRDSLVLRYEIAKWDGDQARATHFVPLTVEQSRRKVRLLAESYPSQAGRDWWDDELFLGLMRLRGVECRAPYAEGYIADKVHLDFG